MPEEYSLSPLMSPRDLCSHTTAAVDFEIYSGDWASLATQEGAVKRTLLSRSLVAPAECRHEGCTWTGPYGDFPDHIKSCPFTPQCRYPTLGREMAHGQVAEQDENQCPWQQHGCLHCSSSSSGCLHCTSSAPWGFGEHAEEVHFQRGELRNIQDRLDHIESTLEKWKLNKDEMDARIDAVEKDTGEKIEQLSRACYQLDKRIKKLPGDRKTFGGFSSQEGLDTALREVKDSVKDMNVTLIQGLQDKVRAAEVYKKFDDIDDLLRQLHDQVKICHHAQHRLCRAEDHAALQAQVSHLEAQLWDLQPNSEVPTANSSLGSCASMPGHCISWNVAEAMQTIASDSHDLSFSSFNRVSSSIFQVLELRGLRLAFVRKQPAALWDVPKSWCYLHAPKGAYLEFVMSVGSEERRFAHEFQTSRSFGGVFNLPFTSNFDAGDLHEGIFVQTLCEGSDGRQSTYPRLACVVELVDAETINGRSRKVAWVAFPDKSEQAVELYWITCVQKLPTMSVVITHARQSRYYGNDVSVTSVNVVPT